MKNNKGFTLIELMAVIALLGVILAIVVRSVIVSMEDAKKETEKVFVSKIEDSIEQYITRSKENLLVQEEVGTISKKNSSNDSDSPVSVKLYKIRKSEKEGIYEFTFQDIMNTGFIKKEDLVNPAKENEKCNINSVINIYRDEDFVYYYGDIDLGCVIIKGNINIENLNVAYPEVQLEKPVVTPETNDELTKLVPIKYSEKKRKWIVTSEKDLDWYDYEKQKWANAAILNDNDYTLGRELDLDNNVRAMFVWIPRFSYTIGCADINKDGTIRKGRTVENTSTECLGYKDVNGLDLSYTNDKNWNLNIVSGGIDVKFVSVNDEIEMYSGDYPVYDYDINEPENRQPSNWYTHPAFISEGKQLSGIWVGKFETTGSAGSLTILPNKSPFVNQSIVNQYSASKNIISNSKYESHMMKNSEWGAVAYLSQSKYGKYGNSDYIGLNKLIYNNNYYSSSSTFLTGVSGGEPRASTSNSVTCEYDDTCGLGASTTGNIYGIYDMSGGSWDRVMGNYNNEMSSSGFTSTQNGNEYNLYTTPNIFTQKFNETNGHALNETRRWNGNISRNFEYEKGGTWLNRGGRAGISNEKTIEPGLFNNYDSNGAASSVCSFRVTVIENKG